MYHDTIHNQLYGVDQSPEVVVEPYVSAEQLEAFLTQLIVEDKVVLEGNQYRKRTSGA